MKFTKMQALGNDFMIVGSPRSHFMPDGDLIAEVCDRKYGIGCDCFVTVGASENADYRMRVFNPDGFEAEMCGNALRCSAKYVFSSGYSTKKCFSVETLSGIRRAELSEDGSNVRAFVGVPEIESFGSISLAGLEFPYVSVSVGNPHCVLFTGGIGDGDFRICGRAAETHPMFPNGTNVEFAAVSHSGDILLRIWERGIGETLSCATGSCAAAFAAYKDGRCGSSVSVHQPGGTLSVDIDGSGNTSVLGECRTVFRGEYDFRRESRN